jgi:2-polyprenyl-3-methyl-5-hydroxy-6-metoxy-1,4-benzoquinol methylase
MKTDTTSQEFFDGKYRHHTDPWNFANDPYETGRYQAILHALTHRRYDRAFEPGCSIGVLTEKLARICNQVQAMDISPIAVGEARMRCRDLGNVEITSGPLPGNLPDGSFDLIVFSEVGYYLGEDALQALGKKLVQRLSQGGVLLAAHWLGQSADHRLTGDRVHEILETLDGLVHEHRERHPGFRLDRWVRA